MNLELEISRKFLIFVKMKRNSENNYKRVSYQGNISRPVLLLL